MVRLASVVYLPTYIGIINHLSDEQKRSVPRIKFCTLQQLESFVSRARSLESFVSRSLNLGSFSNFVARWRD
jgi:hypothetical protein